MSSIQFTPPGTLGGFWRSQKYYQFVIGPLGSSKTTNMVMKMLTVAANQTPQPDGIRRTRFAIVRNTLQQIKTTVLKDIEEWLRPIYRYKVSDSVVQIRAGDIHSDWHLIPLDDPADQRRLLSMQLTLAYFNEFREIDLELVAAAAGRVGRYPSKAHGGCTYAGIWGDSNPPSEDSPWYEFLVLDKPDNCDYFHQPGGMDPEADWTQWLRDDYYDNIIQGHDQGWIDVHVHAKWGESTVGQAVFKNSFNADWHVADPRLAGEAVGTGSGDRVRPSGPTLRPVSGYPLIIGMDFARWPAALICQLDHRGRFLVFQELEQENTGVEQFVTSRLIPTLSDERFRGKSCFIVGDPAGRQRSQIGEESVFSMLHRLGFAALPASTNNITPRIRAVEKFMLQQRDGKPAFLIDAIGCPKLIKALKSEYKYKKKKDGSLENVPDKARPWADLVDALQYGCLGTASNVIGRVMRRSRTETAPPPSASGWT